MRLFGPNILILLGNVDRLGNQLPMSHAISTQLIRHGLSGLAAILLDNLLKNPLAAAPSRLDRFATDDDFSFRQQIFDISVTQIEAIVEPDCVGEDVRWEPVAFISIHGPILATWAI